MGMTVPNVILLTAAIAVGSAELALAQTSGADPHHPADPVQATQPSGMEDTTPQGQSAMPGGSGMMQSGMMGGMPTTGMRGPMMKIMFAIADADGDGALSFEEVTAIHKPIFGSVDANKDGKVTPEEMQMFWGP
ncbi:EF-hand domain-containing protein [Rhizobium binae]|uniref:EF-hand domain-containing protein n=1 Tax=Rhizobium binae TaxID=1138190 RepID=UPI003CCFF2DD